MSSRDFRKLARFLSVMTRCRAGRKLTQRDLHPSMGSDSNSSVFPSPPSCKHTRLLLEQPAIPALQKSVPPRLARSSYPSRSRPVRLHLHQRKDWPVGLCGVNARGARAPFPQLLELAPRLCPSNTGQGLCSPHSCQQLSPSTRGLHPSFLIVSMRTDDQS